ELVMGDPFWRDRAACLSVGPEIFFVRTKAAAAPAIALCMGCDVRQQCAQAASNNPNHRRRPRWRLVRRLGHRHGLHHRPRTRRTRGGG
ncbi:WhiB family transcriptional regulator, partial [Streptomyces californicus]